MSVGETPITVVGNLTEDPELRFTPAGVEMTRFTIASTPRSFDKTTNTWQDGTALFLRATAWRGLADHCAESLRKGTRVVATGYLRQSNWTTEDGEKRSMLAMDVEDIGPSLRFATATITKTARTAPVADPWTTATATPAGTAAPAPDPASASARASAAWSGGGEEPPF